MPSRSRRCSVTLHRWAGAGPTIRRCVQGGPDPPRTGCRRSSPGSASRSRAGAFLRSRVVRGSVVATPHPTERRSGRRLTSSRTACRSRSAGPPRTARRAPSGAPAASATGGTDPGSSSSVTSASWSEPASQSTIDTIISRSMSSRTSPRSMPNSTNSSVPYGSSLTRNRLMSRLSPRSVAVVADEGHAIGDPVLVDRGAPCARANT